MSNHANRCWAAVLIFLVLLGLGEALAVPPSPTDGWTVLQIKTNSNLLGNPHFDAELPDTNPYFHYTYWDFAGRPDAYAVDTAVDHGGGTTIHSVRETNSTSDDQNRLAQQAVNAPWTLAHTFAPNAARPLYFSVGEYVDSYQSHGWDYNFRTDQLPKSSQPPTFDHLTKHVVIPELASINEYMTERVMPASALQGHPLMSNTALRMQPWGRNFFDVLGDETALYFNTDRAEPDWLMSYRRALARYKPFATLSYPNLSFERSARLA